MSLMKWFRKNNARIMAFVVIVLMLVFISGPAMNYLSSGRKSVNQAVARYGDDEKITGRDLAEAQEQLELLNMLGANMFLRVQDPRMAPMQDLGVVLLGELLFSERATVSETLSWIRQMVSNGGYRISDKQINEIYSREYPPNMYWLLLAKEAERVGVRIPPELAKEQLEIVIPRLREGLTYSQLINSIIQRRKVSEGQIIEAFRTLVSILEYTKSMCSMENRTCRQILHEVSWVEETMDVNYVRFEAGVFSDKSYKPSEEEITSHFEKYKGYFAGEVTQENPYGFGYKLGDRVMLEYIGVRLDDVASKVERPTQEETEDFYQQNLQIFVQYLPSDPNDPNSPMIQRARSYAEVAPSITKQLYQRRVDSKAEQILAEAKSITEANLTVLSEEQNLSDEQYEKAAVDYEKTAAQLSEKHDIKVYAGRTEMLNAVDMQSDEELGSLFIRRAGTTGTVLVRIVFSVEQLKASELGPFDAKAPRLYENIGPLKDAREMMEGYEGANMLLVRVVAAEKASEPENLNQKIYRKAVLFDRQSKTEDFKTIRELVIEDMRRLAALDETRAKVDEFVKLAGESGWQQAIDKFNELYGKPAKKMEDSPMKIVYQTFTLSEEKGLRRISGPRLTALESRYEGDPMAASILRRSRIESMLKDEIYGLVPENSDSPAESGEILEFKPNMTYYCLQSLLIHRLNQDKFDKLKGADIIGGDFSEGQVMAMVHYNPKNILKRMNFSLIKREKDITPADSAENEPSEPLE